MILILILDYGMEEARISRRRMNKFCYRLFKQFRHRERRLFPSLPLSTKELHEQTALCYLDQVFGKKTIYHHVLLPTIVGMIEKDGYPVQLTHRMAILENLEKASDLFQDLDRGLFRSDSGCDTHRMLEQLLQPSSITGRPRLFQLLQRIHPDRQLDFSQMVLESAQAKKVKESLRFDSRMRKRFEWMLRPRTHDDVPLGSSW